MGFTVSAFHSLPRHLQSFVLCFLSQADPFLPMVTKCINSRWTDVKRHEVCFESPSRLGAKIKKYVSEPGCAGDRNREEI